MKNHLTPNLQPPTSYAGCPCSVSREPCSENWYVDQRRTGWDAMFTFSGKERDQETGYGYFGARYYDSDLSIWLSVDPMASKYPSLSPYVYCANNPINIIDPDGRSISEFDENGNYLRTIKDNWWHNTFVGHSGRMVDGKGNTTLSFGFADPENDVSDLKNGFIKKVEIISNESINAALENSGVFDKENQENKESFILKQSSILSGNGGQMDYTHTASGFKSGEDKGIPAGVLYITKTKFGYMAHNYSNFGNFLWGAGAKALGFLEPVARAGAHINNIINDPENAGKPFYNRKPDSPDDQRSISTGFQWMRENKKK